MKQSKLIILCLMLLGMFVSFTSCDNQDEEQTNSSLLGSRFTGLLSTGDPVDISFYSSSKGKIGINNNYEDFSWGWDNNADKVLVLIYVDGGESAIVIQYSNDTYLSGYYFESISDYEKFIDNGKSDATQYGGVAITLNYYGKANN